MTGWTSFYGTVGGAAATLLGLLFVAVSVKAQAALGREAPARPLVEQAFQNYLAVLIVSLMALVPEMQPARFGTVVLLATGSLAFWVVVRLVRAVAGVRRVVVGFHTVRRHLGALAGFGMLVWAAAGMAAGRHDTAYTFAAGVIVLLFAATVAAWGLLRELAGGR